MTPDTDPAIIEHPPAEEISNAEYPVPTEILEWEAQNLQEVPE